MVHRLYILILLAVLMAACSSDDVGTGGTDWSDADGMVTVGLRFSAASGGAASTRAWQDNENATDNEMMNIWTVVVVNASDGKVQAIHACKPTGDTKPEVDDYVNLTPGTYTFYSFANMAPSVVMQLLGISGTGATGGEVTRGGNGNLNFNLNDNTNPNENPDANPNEDPTQGGNEENANPPKSSQDDIASKEDDTVYEIAFDANAKITVTPEEVKVRVDGNNFDPTAAENGFGAKGIPMSNVQSKEITSSTVFDLIVVRMIAKIELRLYNETGADVKVKSVTLSDVNGNYNDNIKMLPSLTNHDDMEAHHGDIHPNLGANTYPGDYTCTPTTAVTVPSTNTLANGTYQTLSFYVNESSKPKNPYERFFLTLEIDKGTGNPSEYRYALIDDDNSNSKGGDGTTGKWDYIARNDYRIIPIVLDDYTLDIIPYDFPAIGVYPASVKNEDGLYTINFHDYGHFHLLPVVTKMSTGAKIAFNNGTPLTDGTVTWGLYNNLWADSWTSWTDHTKATAYVNSSASPAFYRTGYDTSNPTDGDEVGGEPVWYPNNLTTKPQWDPAASANYQPFIFGYIADPEGTLAADRKVYHELKIQLYDGINTTARREMLARMYMILDTQQMLYAAPAKGLSTQRRSHF